LFVKRTVRRLGEESSPNYGAAVATAIANPVSTYELLRFGVFLSPQEHIQARTELFLIGAGAVGLLALLVGGAL
jgi:hypothetical protein